MVIFAHSGLRAFNYFHFYPDSEYFYYFPALQNHSGHDPTNFTLIPFCGCRATRLEADAQYMIKSDILDALTPLRSSITLSLGENRLVKFDKGTLQI